MSSLKKEKKAEGKYRNIKFKRKRQIAMTWFQTS